MVARDTKVIYGTTEVYDSSDARGFTESENYPIAWEIIFVNDAVGKEFAANANMAFSKLPKEKGYLLNFEGEDSEATRCLECVFKDKSTLRQFLNESMPDITIYDEHKNKVIPKQKLLDKAKEITSQTEAGIVF